MSAITFVKCLEDPVWEEDWFRYLLGDHELTVVQSLDYSHIVDNAVYAVKGTKGLDRLPEEFYRKVEARSGVGLLHLGDEFLRGPYHRYRHFSFVIRTHWTPFLESKGVIHLPIGPSNASSPTEPTLPASQRPLFWGFTAARSQAREAVIAALGDLGPNFHHLVDLRAGEQHLPRDRFLGLLRESTFSPCPMGNAFIEVMRLYEALENGGIPVATKRRHFDYYTKRFGKDHPIPLFYDWGSAKRWMKKIYADKPALDALQGELTRWWQATKADARRRTGLFVADGLAGRLRGELQRDFTPENEARRKNARMIEILKHHDIAAVMGRAHVAGRAMLWRSGILKPPPGAILD